MLEIFRKELFLFDIEGIVVTGVDKPFRPIPFAPEFISEIEGEVRFISNISRRSARYVKKILESVGIKRGEIFTAGRCAAIYVKRVNPSAKCFLITEGGMVEDFEREGLQVAFKPPVDFVVVGIKRSLSFDEVNFAVEMIMEGASFVEVGITKVYRGEFLGKSGFFMGDVPICSAITSATGVEPIKIGKPYPEIFKIALGNTPPECAVMFGDKIQTDIKGAKDLGMTTVLVEELIEKSHFVPDDIPLVEPDYRIKNFGEMLKLMSKT